MNKLITSIAIASAAALAPAAVTAAANGAGGVTGPAFYVDGEMYRTVLTPTDFTDTGAPLHSYDTIYDIAGQPNVATAAPGDRDYNGGRWMVLPVTIDDYDDALMYADANDSGDIDSDAELHEAVSLGLAAIGDPVASFECPVIPVPGR